MALTTYVKGRAYDWSHAIGRASANGTGFNYPQTMCLGSDGDVIVFREFVGEHAAQRAREGVELAVHPPDADPALFAQDHDATEGHGHEQREAVPDREAQTKRQALHGSPLRSATS